MQQSESTTKYVLSWNDQALDTYHDIIVSLDYAMYNYNDTPTCGFCVALFESLNEKPRGGGSFYSLGYTPNDINDTCNPKGYNGLESALYGIGFDVNGIFAKKTNRVDGLSATVANSICLRDGIKNNFSFIQQSENLLYSQNISLAQQLTSITEKIEYKKIRIVFKNALTKLEIEAKKEEENDFKLIFESDLRLMNPTSVKVGLFFTSLDQNTRFELRQFNVAGFPSRYEKTKLLTTCIRTISTNKNIFGNKLPAYNEWIAANHERGYKVYKSDSDSYIFKQNIISSGDLKILNYTDKYIFAKTNNELAVYEYKGNGFVKQNTIIIPNNDAITCCAGYENTLVVGTTSYPENFYIYQYYSNSVNLQNIGNWVLYQTLNTGASGYGNTVEIGKNHILMSSTDDIVTSYKKNSIFGYVYHQTITKPNSGAITFGKTISIYDKDVLIGAPYAQKTSFKNFGNGEVYHYYLSENTKLWTLIMEMGDFFKINTPAGNFGHSIKIDKDVAIVGTPGEEYYISGDSEKPNVGRAYVFRKTPYGYFTQTNTLAPLSTEVRSYTFFGSQVNTFQNLAIVSLPYTLDRGNAEISIFNLDCVFETPPLHLPIPTNAIQLINLEGFVIDKEKEDYMVHFQSPNPSISYSLLSSTITNKPIYELSPLSITLSGSDFNIYGVDNWYWSTSGTNMGYTTYTTQNIDITFPLAGEYIATLSATNTYGMGVETIKIYLA